MAANRRRCASHIQASVRPVVHAGITGIRGISGGTVPEYARHERLTVADVTRRRREARGHRAASSRWGQIILAVVLVGSLTSGTAIATNTLGAGDKFERLVRRVELAL